MPAKPVEEEEEAEDPDDALAGAEGTLTGYAMYAESGGGYSIYLDQDDASHSDTSVAAPARAALPAPSPVAPPPAAPDATSPSGSRWNASFQRAVEMGRDTPMEALRRAGHIHP